MSKKLNRRYRLLIETDAGDFVEITDPITIEFDISRSISNSLNRASFRIYNLAQSTRTRIFQDKFRIQDKGDGSFYKQIIMQAGYNQLSTIFQGNILSSYPIRNGGNVIQNIEAIDGLYGQANSFSSLTISDGEPLPQAIDKLAKDLKKIATGTISPNIEGSFNKKTSFYGNTFTVLKDNFGNEKIDVFIDKEQLFIMGKNEVIDGQVPLIKSDTGLLGTPIRQLTFLQVEILFEPRITIGQLVQIESSINPVYDGLYKVQGITHSSTISGAIAGNARTVLQLYLGNQNLGGLQTISSAS